MNTKRWVVSGHQLETLINADGSLKNGTDPAA
jgi:hypothetical protein